MKNRLYILITILFAAFVCFSCKSEVDKAGKAGAEKQKISINVKFPSLEKNILEDRKAFLTDDELDEIIGSYSFTLTAKRNAASEAETLFSALSYEELRDFSDEILTGSWIFTLLAYSRETRELCLSGTDTATISSENVSLNFEMQYVEDAAGVFEFKIPIEKYTDEEDFSYGYHKIVVKSFASPNQDYLVFPNGANKEKVSTAVDVNSEGTGESYSCTYSITLGVGKYMVFIYEPMSHTGLTVNDYYAYPKQNELAYIYGGVTTEKDYTNLLANTVQDVDVELYVGPGYAEELSDFSVIGAEDNQKYFPTIDYDYNNETGWLTYKNSHQKDLLLPKLTFDDKYLIGWYTDEECTQKADYVNYNQCNYTTDTLSSVVYFWYDIAKVSGKLKLYAKFAPRYNILIDTDGGRLSYNRPNNYYDEELVAPAEGSSVYTLQNCAYETSVGVFSADKDGYVFVGWYNDSAYTSPIENSKLNINLNTTETINIYARFIESTARMDIKYVYIYNDTETDITINNYEQYVQAGSARNDGTVNIYLDERYTPSRDGFEFLGWYYDSDFENELDYDSYFSRYQYILSIKDFDPDKEIKIYSKWFEYANDTVNVTVKNYTQNNLKVKMTSNSSGTLSFQAVSLDETNPKTYTEYVWYVNGEKAQGENNDSFQYRIYETVEGVTTNFYTDSSILISFVAKINNDDASLDLLLDLETEVSISFAEYNSNGLKMTCEEVTVVDDQKITHNCYKFTVSSITESLVLDDSYCFWYMNGARQGQDALGNLTGQSAFLLEKTTTLAGYYLITCELLISDTNPIESYSASYAFIKQSN